MKIGQEETPEEKDQREREAKRLALYKDEPDYKVPVRRAFFKVDSAFELKKNLFVPSLEAIREMSGRELRQ